MFGELLIGFPSTWATGADPFTPRDKKPNVHREFAIVECNFFGGLAELIARAQADSRNHPIVAYVHGFNTRFDEAAARSAQLAHDANIEGAGLFFSWPSDPTLNALPSMDYAAARLVKDVSAEDFHTVLDGLVRVSQTGLAIVAHSMGADLVLTAMKDRVVSGKVAQTVLFAPDVFMSDFVPNLQAALVRTTDDSHVYCATDDEALWLARRGDGRERLGLCPALVTPHNTDNYVKVRMTPTLPAVPRFDWHSLYATNGVLLGRLSDTLRKSPLPVLRRGTDGWAEFVIVH